VRDGGGGDFWLFFFVVVFFSFLGIRKRNPDPEKGKTVKRWTPLHRFEETRKKN
jgi:hypothetical protein